MIKENPAFISEANIAEVSCTEKVYEFLKSAGSFYPATADGDQSHVRSFGTSHLFESKLYILTSKSKAVSRQLSANPKCEICAFQDGVWLRVTAELAEHDRVEAKKSMPDDHPKLRKTYNENDNNTQALYMKDPVVSFFTSASEVQRA